MERAEPFVDAPDAKRRRCKATARDAHADRPALPDLPDGVCEVNRQRCWRCLHPNVPLPACKCCGTGVPYVSGYCRVCHPRLGIPESCRSCLAWTAERLRGMCNPCYQFARHHGLGVCGTCRRRVAVREGVCRLCRIQASLVARPYWESTDLSVAARTGHQLSCTSPCQARPSMPRRHRR